MSAQQRPPAEPARRAVRLAQAGTGYPLLLIRQADPYQLSLDRVAQRSGLPPELVGRFVALGLIDAHRDGLGRLRFRADAPAAVAKVQRLRSGLSLNYAAIGLVLDLLDRIDQLETTLRRRERAAEERTPWT
ncbi:chaperone modulator CbpM [Streptacidiphilus sp. P02-A3a]|uniref:chaperone modulator CbpM n=1 Tax=Streptacidiphilus sp. P02-A3a TaxID=2704468 RepID=UPI0015FB75C2|nr:chaperone modulator CbpM [Streptacidiphilus sp. P02-A3a]QMU70652.1 hypothetical protein GXP74_23060 [Streptacidiphilus sp. P02-A3a]